MYRHFHLVLVITHASNIRCTCGPPMQEQVHRPMPEAIAIAAIDRALASVDPDGGTLELGFGGGGGGEPLLDAPLVRKLVNYARHAAPRRRVTLVESLTTNGTITTPAAWAVMLEPQLQLAVRHDGVPGVHDAHRRTRDDRGTSSMVLDTVRELVHLGKPLRILMTVTPDGVDRLADGIDYLHNMGVRQVEPVLDVWARWTPDDVARLERAVALCAQVWRNGLPEYGVSWFDEKAAALLGRSPPADATARCCYGDGQIAVAPSGHLYPCDRVVADDGDENPARLPGAHALMGTDFLSGAVRHPPRSHASCDACAMASICNTTCRCNNLIRTGDIRTPDELLCRWNQAVLLETARALQESAPVPQHA